MPNRNYMPIPELEGQSDMNIERDTTTEENHRIQRLKLAEAFLDTVLLPEHEDGQLINKDNIVVWLEAFRKRRPVPGNDFSLDHVWGIAWSRVMELKENKDGKSTDEYNAIEQVWDQITDIQSSEDHL